MKCPINYKHGYLTTLKSKYDVIPFCKKCGIQKSEIIQDMLIELQWNEERVERIYESHQK